MSRFPPGFITERVVWVVVQNERSDDCVTVYETNLGVYNLKKQAEAGIKALKGDIRRALGYDPGESWVWWEIEELELNPTSWRLANRGANGSVAYLDGWEPKQGVVNDLD